MSRLKQLLLGLVKVFELVPFVPCSSAFKVYAPPFLMHIYVSACDEDAVIAMDPKEAAAARNAIIGLIRNVWIVGGMLILKHHVKKKILRYKQQNCFTSQLN